MIQLNPKDYTDANELIKNYKLSKENKELCKTISENYIRELKVYQKTYIEFRKLVVSTIKTRKI